MQQDPFQSTYRFRHCPQTALFKVHHDHDRGPVVGNAWFITHDYNKPAVFDVNDPHY